MTYIDAPKITNPLEIASEIVPIDNPLTLMSGSSIPLNALDALRAETQSPPPSELAINKGFNTSAILQNMLSTLSTMHSDEFASCVQDICDHAKDPKEAANAIETVLDKIYDLPMETRENKEALFGKLTDVAYILGMHQEVLGEIDYGKKMGLLEALTLPIKDYERSERENNMARDLSSTIGNDPKFKVKDTEFVTNLVQTLKNDEELTSLIETARSEKTLDSYAACAKRVIECASDELNIPVPDIEISTDRESDMGIEASYGDYKISINIPKLIPSDKEGLGYVIDAAIHETRHLYQEMLGDSYTHQIWGIDPKRPELASEELASDLILQARNMALARLLYTTKGHMDYLSTALEKDARKFAREVTSEFLSVNPNRDGYPYERMF